MAPSGPAAARISLPEALTAAGGEECRREEPENRLRSSDLSLPPWVPSAGRPWWGRRCCCLRSPAILALGSGVFLACWWGG